MGKLIKGIWFALAVLAAISAILLFSDLENRKGRAAKQAKEYPSVAILQFSSTLLLDNHVSGVIDKLKERGYVAPDGSNLRHLIAQGDLSMANLMAREVISGDYEMVITSSTVMMQTFANVNKEKGKIHVFGGVTDPFSAGVGITGHGPGDHPPYLAGIGTFQPVTEAFRVLRELHPGIKRAGVVWNPGEHCSQACLLKARAICSELGIELVEAIAANTNEVPEAVRTLLAKGVEVIWIGGDTVAISSAGMIIKLSREKGVPVITNDPMDAPNGALFGLGADYFTVGQYTGAMAADILDGKKPSEISIENVVPQVLDINREVLAWLGESWSLTPSVEKMLNNRPRDLQTENQVLDFALLKDNQQEPAPEVLEKAGKFLHLHEKYGRPVRISLITLVENYTLEEAISGVGEGLKAAGLEEGVDYAIRQYSAQGEIGQLPQMVDAVLLTHPDAIITVTTPALITVARKVTTLPVIFTVASDPVKLGIFSAGRPENICGVYDNPQMGQLLDMAIKHGKALKAVGTIFDPAQINSMISVERLRTAGKEKGITILEAPSSAVSDLAMATRSLAARGAGAILLSADNLVNTGLPIIMKEARQAGLPVYVTDLDMIAQGAAGGVGVSYREWGKQSGQMAARVLAGIPPAKLPVEETRNLKTIEPSAP